MRFTEMDLCDEVQEALSFMGFENATPIQAQAIPLILQKKDVLACAQTGTGKTAAFILPILDIISRNHTDDTNTLIICPTRELALQIDQQIQGLAYFCNVTSMTIYGGGQTGDWKAQKKALNSGVEIVVGTPGKLMSHIINKNINVDSIQHLILDEADRMLDMGFYEDICRIISFLPEKRQNLLFSATMPPKIRDLAKYIQNDPEEINISISKPAEKVLQAAYLVFDEHKLALIDQLISDKPEYKSVLVFSSTKKNVGKIVKQLSGKNYTVAGISSDLEQREREEVLLGFRTKNTRVLVATDVLSRGIDIKDINLVINYDVPSNGEDYVHRVGRTARADTTGVALTFLNPDDMQKFSGIERLIEKDIIKINTPDSIGPSPEWKVRSKKNNKGKKFYKKKSK